MENTKNINEYSKEEYKERKRILKYLRGSKERFKNSKNFRAFERNSKDFINILFDALHFDEDEIVLYTINKTLNEVRELLLPHISNNEVYKFLVIVDGIYSMKYIGVIERFYR